MRGSAATFLVLIGGAWGTAESPAPVSAPAQDKDKADKKAPPEVELTIEASAASTKLLQDGSNAEPVTLTFTFKNVSGKKLDLDTTWLEARALSLSVVGPDGKPLATKLDVTNAIRGKVAAPPPAIQTLEPGATWEATKSVPGAWSTTLGAVTAHVFDRPGTYRIKAVYKTSGLGAPAWNGTVTSNEIKIEVKETGK